MPLVMHFYTSTPNTQTSSSGDHRLEYREQCQPGGFPALPCAQRNGSRASNLSGLALPLTQKGMTP
jgi:hypothetical protein